ncbi:hypothetical protein CA85_11130 [Allorhodopirellula solitaria]|uniref:Uncharacterized protein n=1 Tax=Allorhodopirellula solitaria TaxID=2527987 RepID=A0A5C5YEP0_9BACT|nr:hypothetical protein CA85_11130 [Allorhodopirellula solitaria]
MERNTVKPLSTLKSNGSLLAVGLPIGCAYRETAALLEWTMAMV